MIFNYKRVSTTDQNTERQLLDIVCDRAYIEKISGKKPNFAHSFLQKSIFQGKNRAYENTHPKCG